MTEEMYFLIGFAIWAAGLIALPVFIGYQQAKDRNPPEGLFFVLAIFVIGIIPFWGFVVGGAVVMAIGYPIVIALSRVGKKLAEGKP